MLTRLAGMTIGVDGVTLGKVKVVAPASPQSQEETVAE